MQQGKDNDEIDVTTVSGKAINKPERHGENARQRDTKQRDRQRERDIKRTRHVRQHTTQTTHRPH